MKHLIKHKARPWGQEVWFTQDPKTLRRLSKRFGFSCSDADDAVGVLWTTSGPYVLWVDPKATASTLVHECCHATLNILTYCGVDPVASKGEPCCYTLDSMVDAFLPHLKTTN